MRIYLISSLFPFVKHLCCCCKANFRMHNDVLWLTKALDCSHNQFIQASFLLLKRLKVPHLWDRWQMIALKHLLYCSLLSPSQIFPLSLSACHDDFCLKQEILWSGLREAFACRCRRATQDCSCYISFLFLLVVVVGGGYQSAVREET